MGWDQVLGWMVAYVTEPLANAYDHASHSCAHNAGSGVQCDRNRERHPEPVDDRRSDGQARQSIGENDSTSECQYHHVRINELIPHRRIVWETEFASIPQLKGTLIAFNLSTHEGDVIIDFAQSGLPKLDEVYAIFSSGWYLYLVKPASISGNRKGTPHPFLDFGIRFSG